MARARSKAKLREARLDASAADVECASYGCIQMTSCKPVARSCVPIVRETLSCQKTLLIEGPRYDIHPKTPFAMDPPTYEESASAYEDQQIGDSKGDSKVPQRFSIREEVGLSRTQHVAALVSKLLPQVRDRARQGLSKSTLLLIPSNQDAGRKGQLVGFPADEIPILIQLEGRQDTLEFWTQQQAIDELKTQLLVALSDSMPKIVEPLPERPKPPAAVKSSFWGRKQRAPDTRPEPPRKVEKPPVSVDVQMDEVHFRAETEYGLYETLRGRCVMIEVDVR